MVLLTIFSLIFVAAATMHFIETYHDDSVDNIFYDFHNVLYFIVVVWFESRVTESLANPNSLID